MTNIMVDLETLGTKPGCAILSIGAVAFSQDGLGTEFYASISNPTGNIEAGTVLWWLNQSEDARYAARSGKEEHGFAIYRFHTWFKEQGGKHFWCHGATFDEPILRAAAGMEVDPPWKFWDVRCTRTLYALSGISPSRAVGYHNALDDAKGQAVAAVASLNKLGWPR